MAGGEAPSLLARCRFTRCEVSLAATPHAPGKACLSRGADPRKLGATVLQARPADPAALRTASGTRPADHAIDGRAFDTQPADHAIDRRAFGMRPADHDRWESVRHATRGPRGRSKGLLLTSVGYAVRSRLTFRAGGPRRASSQPRRDEGRGDEGEHDGRR